MSTHLPYRITHVNLQQPTEIPSLNLLEQGNYLVFWWKNIPLGDLYIESGNRITADEYYKKVGEAVLPALNQYAKNTAELKTNSNAISDPESLKNLENWLPGNLHKAVTKAVPEEVAVSVVVCTRNRATHLKRCLHMLQNLTCRPAEIIVVDNAPDDDSSQKVVSAFKNVIYIREPRTGLDIARNTGAKKAKLPIVAYTDDDVSVQPLWAYHIWQSFQDPKTAAMTGLVIAAELATEAQCIFEKHWSFNRGYLDIKYDTEFFRNTLRKGPPVWKIGAGANMAFRREVFEEVGYFDELLDVGAAGCNGDSEMWYRILKHGHTIHYNPRAVVFHEHRRELEALKKQIFSYMRGHAAAALIQQQQFKKAGYIRHLGYTLLIAYSRSILKGFPQYKAQYRTIWAQISGLISGVAYYYMNQRKSKTTLH